MLVSLFILVNCLFSLVDQVMMQLDRFSLNHLESLQRIERIKHLEELKQSSCNITHSNTERVEDSDLCMQSNSQVVRQIDEVRESNMSHYSLHSFNDLKQIETLIRKMTSFVLKTLSRLSICHLKDESHKHLLKQCGDMMSRHKVLLRDLIQQELRKLQLNVGDKQMDNSAVEEIVRSSDSECLDTIWRVFIRKVFDLLKSEMSINLDTLENSCTPSSSGVRGVGNSVDIDNGLKVQLLIKLENELNSASFSEIM